MHIDIISNGLGGASMMLMILAAEGITLDDQFLENYNARAQYGIRYKGWMDGLAIAKTLSKNFDISKPGKDIHIRLKSRLSITADMQEAEDDRLWSTGRRSGTKEYFDEIVKPYGKQHGVEAVLIRKRNKQGEEIPSLLSQVEKGVMEGIPTYGSRGGQNIRSCTEKYKISAVRQELRRRGALTADSALSLTYDELDRVKPSKVKWNPIWYPLIELKLTRHDVKAILDQRQFPYLASTECFFCPLQNYWRWGKLTEATIARAEAIENGFDGQYLTDERVPLRQALEIKKLKYERKVGDSSQLELFTCDTAGYCGDALDFERG